MNKEQLKEILKLHQMWLDGEKEGVRANLSEANLSGANLSRADLSGANLRWADLRGADLYGANLSRANLSQANLSRVNLCWADLYGANLSRANLRRANLSQADLSKANLRGANLFQANLSEANLSGTNLYRANLSWANLYGAKLPAPSTVLLASWGELSPELTKKAMAYDAFFHDNPEAFTEWANGGKCPYAERRYQRACNFYEDKDLWDPTLPCPRGFDLMVEIIREKCANSDWH